MDSDKKQKRNNRWFIALTILGCVLLSSILIWQLDKKDIPNTVTVIGTVLTIGALLFTIREQVRLTGISRAIQLNTQEIQDKIEKRTFQFNLDKCITCIDKMQMSLHEPNLIRVHDKLEELSDYITECMQILTAHIVDNPNNNHNFDDRIYMLEKYRKEVGAFKITIICSNYDKASISDIKSFVTKITEIKDYINEIRASNLYKIIQ